MARKHDKSKSPKHSKPRPLARAAPVHPSPDQFDEVLGLIEAARAPRFTAINKELIDLYWDIGATISRRIAADGWGQGTVLAIADHIRKRRPGMSGFSARNLWRMIESNPPQTAGFQPARLGGFLPQGFSPSSRLGGVSKRVSIIVNVRCNGAGLRYNPGSSLATRCWRLRGEGPLVKQQPRSKARPAACIVVRREACWCSRSPQPGGTAVRLQRFQAIRCGFAKYRIPRKRVMRRCLDTGQERTPVARGNPRSCGASAPAECHAILRDLPRQTKTLSTADEN